MATVNASPLVASTGLPAWATIALDSLLGSGVIGAEQIEDLGTIQLVTVAALYVRAVSAGQPFDAGAALATARAQSIGARRREREAA
jgi:hypothetical protein